MPYIAAVPGVLAAAVLFAALDRRRRDDRFDAGWLAGYCVGRRRRVE